MTDTQTDLEIKKYLKRLTFINRLDQVMLRGCVMGVFTAVGATIGFALFIAIASQFVSQFRTVPLLDTILEQTKLDVLIENQLNKIEQETGGEAPDPETPESPETPAVTTSTYQSAQIALSFEYPSSFSSVVEKEGEGDGERIIQLTGTGALQSLEVYFNGDVTVVGSASQRFVPRNDIDRILVNIYEKGATVENQIYSLPVFHSRVKAGDNYYDFVGIGDSATPKLAREVFTSILASAKFGEN